MKHVNLPSLYEPIKPESRKAFVLAEIGHSHKRMLAMAAEIEVIGTALRENIITSDYAIDWMEENAPGCLGHIPAAIRVIPETR